jgi:hypothetical protein
VNRYPKLLVFCLALALAGGVSCTSSDGPFENQAGVPTGDGGAVPDPSAPEPTDSTGAEPADTTGTEPTDTTSAEPADTAGTVPVGPGEGLLTCEPQPYEAQTGVIGLAGGQINVGNHSLQIPPLALSEDVTITMELIEGSVRSVRLSPEGLQFAIPATLTLNYTGCEDTSDSKRIVYTNEALVILDWLISLDLNTGQVRTQLDHFSRYAVAY